MYAIAFDFNPARLEMFYGSSRLMAYSEIERVLKEFGTTRLQDGLYIFNSKEHRKGLASIHKTIDSLRSIEWFKTAVESIKVFKISDLSDFTETVVLE